MNELELTAAANAAEKEQKPEKRHISRARRNEYIWGWIFVAPLTVGFLLFVAFPLIVALYYSVTEYDLFHAPVFIGMRNFGEVFHDEFFLRSLLNALVYTIGVPIGAFIALILANLLSRIPRGSVVFRMIYYMPTICSAVAITFIWQWMYAPGYGILHDLMRSLGMRPISFLAEKHIMTSMMVMGVWSGMGVSILLFFSALHNVSSTLYDAASLDGANAVEKFIHITLPGVSPTFFYILITGILGAFQAFTNFQVMTGDQISMSNVMPVWWIYKFTGNYGYRYGYASALGLVLGVLLIIISAIQFIVSKYWVKYDN